MQHSVERLLCHHVRSLCLVDHLRTERKGGHPCLFLVHLPDRLHQRRGEQGRRPPVVRHQIDQSGVEVGNVSGLRFNHSRQGQQVDLVLLQIEVVVQMLNILLESSKAGSLYFHGVRNGLACEELLQRQLQEPPKDGGRDDRQRHRPLGPERRVPPRGSTCSHCQISWLASSKVLLAYCSTTCCHFAVVLTTTERSNVFVSWHSDSRKCSSSGILT